MSLAGNIENLFGVSPSLADEIAEYVDDLIAERLDRQTPYCHCGSNYVCTSCGRDLEWL